MQLDPLIYVDYAEDADSLEARLQGIVQLYGRNYAAATFQRYAQKRGPNKVAEITGRIFGITDGEIDPSDIEQYVRDITTGLDPSL